MQCLLPVAAQTDTLQDLLAAGEQALRSGNLERARDSFLDVLRQSAENERALLALGQIHYTVGAFSEAEGYLRRAAAVNPDKFDAYLFLAAALLQQGRRADAVPPLEVAHRLRPTDTDAAKLLSIEYVAQTRYRDAVQTLRPFAELAPKDEEIYLLLIEAYHRAGDADSSVKLAEIAVSQLPDSPRLNCWLGFQLTRRGRSSDAKPYLQRALELDANYEPAYYVMGDLLLREGKHEEAAEYLRVAVAKNPEDADASVLLSRSLAGINQLSQAVDVLRDAASLGPDEAKVHLELSRLYMKLGDKQQAQEAAERYRATKRSSPAAVELPAKLGFDTND